MKPTRRLRILACLLALVVLGHGPARGGEAGRPSQLHQQEALLHLERGRRLLGAGSPADALEHLRRAHALAPANATCRRLLAQAEAAAERRPARDLLEPIARQRRLRAQSVVAQVRGGLAEAERALKAKDYPRALQHGQRALTAIEFITKPADGQELRTAASRILAQARAGRDRGLAARRKSDLAHAKADARSDRTRRIQASSGRLATLREEAWKQFNDCEYSKTLAVADRILGIDPDDGEALLLKEEATVRSLAPTSLRGRSKKRRRRTMGLFDAIEKELMTLPKKGEVVLPGKAKVHAPIVHEHPMEAWERTLRSKLTQKIAIDFHATPIREAVGQLSAMGGVNIVLDPAAERDTPITIQRARMPLDSVLRWVAAFGGLRYCLRDGAVYLATPRGLLDEPVQRFYDLSTLVIPRSDSVPTAIVGPIEPLPRKPAPQTTKPVPVRSDLLGQGWAEFVRTTIAPDTWDKAPEDDATLQAAPRYTIQYRNGRIVVLHTPEVHREIEELLNNFRRARNLQVHILCRYLTITRTFMDRLVLGTATWTAPDANGPGEDPTGGKRYAVSPVSVSSVTDIVREFTDPLNPDAAPVLRPLARFTDITPSGGLGLSWTYVGVNGHNASAVLSTVLKEQNGTLLSAPRLTCFNTQRANIQVLKNRNYVRRISSDEEPEIGNVPDGIIFDVQPFVSSDRRHITLVLQPQRRELLSLTEYSFTTGVDEDVPPDWIGPLPIVGRVIQLPTTRLESLGTTVTVPNGGTLLIGGFTEVEERGGIAGVPIIESIPLLKQVFRGWDRAEGRQSLILLVTAETVRDIFEEEE